MGDVDELTAQLEGRFVALEVPVPDHYPVLHDISSQPEVIFRWRDRGMTRSLEGFGQTIWSNSAMAFTIARLPTRNIIGFIHCYGLDTYSRHAKLAMFVSPEAWGDASSMEAAFLFVDHCFKALDLRKLYMEVPEFNLAQFGRGLGRYFAEEGRLREHEYFNGRHWDSVILALYRDRWDDLASKALDRWIARAADEVG